MTNSEQRSKVGPAFCPLCRMEMHVEPMMFIGDAICPGCDRVLWFIQVGDQLRIFDARHSSARRERIVSTIVTQLGVDRASIVNNPNFWRDTQVDSLETVDMILELADEYE